MVEVNNIDSNASTARISLEDSFGVIAASPVWYTLEPNSYTDFGGETTLVARDPISATRRRKKGVITDLDVTGGFNQDVTFTNLEVLWPGLFLTDYVDQHSITNVTADSEITDVANTGSIVTVVTDPSSDILVGHICLFTGFTNDANNGVHVVTAVSSTTITFGGSTFTDEAAPPAGATIKVVGFQFTSDDADIEHTSGELPQLTTVSQDLTAFGLIAGETIFIGGDTTATRFVNAENNKWARLSAAPTTNAMIFDKTSGGTDGETEMTAETTTSVTLQIFFASYLRDVATDDSAYDLKSYHIERSLGIPNPSSAPSVVQSELATGMILNEVSLNFTQADKLTGDFTFVGKDNEQRDGVTAGQERLSTTTGSIATIETADAYNTSSDIPRIKMAIVKPTQTTANRAAPEPLFAYILESTLTIAANASMAKAVGTLGGFAAIIGTFQVSGSVTAYFTDVASVAAVRANEDVTLDYAVVKQFGSGNEQRYTGFYIDVPLIALGDGRLNVEKDAAIQIPLTNEAAEYEDFSHTLMMQWFPYLPDAAAT